MSNSTRMALRQSWLAVVATVAIIALLLIALPATISDGNVASGAVSPKASENPTASPTSEPTVSPTASPTPTPSPTASPTQDPESHYPVAHGWKNQPNGVKYHFNPEKGVVFFWTTMEDNYGTVIWDYDELQGGGVRFEYGDPPVRVKYRKCGMKVDVVVIGYNTTQDRKLPVWPCKYAKKKVKVKITSLKVVKSSPRKVVARGSVQPINKVKRIKVLIKRNGKRVTRWRTAKGKASWRVKYHRGLKTGRYMVVAKMYLADGKTVLARRTFRVR